MLERSKKASETVSFLEACRCAGVLFRAFDSDRLQIISFVSLLPASSSVSSCALLPSCPLALVPSFRRKVQSVLQRALPPVCQGPFFSAQPLSFLSCICLLSIFPFLFLFSRSRDLARPPPILAFILRPGAPDLLVLFPTRRQTDTMAGHSLIG